MSYFQSAKKKLNPGTLVAHKVFVTSKQDIYRFGIVKFDVDDDHVFVMWCPCDDYQYQKTEESILPLLGLVFWKF